MRENELASLLIQMGADRGVDVERAVDELATMALPSFVDSRTFRAAVVEALEAHIRTQMEQRLQLIRRRFDVDPDASDAMPISTPVTPAPQPAVDARPTYAQPVSDVAAAAPVRTTVTPEMPPAQATPPPTVMAPVPADPPTAAPEVMASDADVAPDAETVAEEDELPTDATMVWTTRHG
jgi:hypothetical protein